MTLFKKQSDPMDVTKYHWIIDKVIETIKNSKISADYKDNKSQNQIAADILSVMIENDVTNGDYRYIVSTVKTIFDLISNKIIPRKKRFYKIDKQGYYYIPEVINEKL